MCGIVSAVAQRDVAPILIEGLHRLEYRGYDSAGVALVDGGVLQLRRAVGKVAELQAKVEAQPAPGHLGVAHTRWATHGEVTEANAHPHVSSGRVAVVHNGIIENFEALRDELKAQGYAFASDTDTEVIAHLIDRELGAAGNLADAVKQAVGRLHGAYGLAVISKDDPGLLVVARMGSPLVIGLGIGENFAASDVAALLPVTQRFMYLEEGDVAVLTTAEVKIVDSTGLAVKREVHESSMRADATDKAGYKHYMLKEIHEQPRALLDTLDGRIGADTVLPESLGPRAAKVLGNVHNVHIVACGTSYHAGMVGKYWIEALAGVPVQVELASEYRYRNPVVPAGTLFVTLSQSGETADTLAALRHAQTAGYLATLAICNSPQSSMVRESDLVMLTQAGPEIGVASTKAFTTQLQALLTVAGMLGKTLGALSAEREAELVRQLRAAPVVVEDALRQAGVLESFAEVFVDKAHCLFLGRGPQYPIAMEGALKLKEISYIHAEAYAAGELKHGPLALVDEHMPVVVVAPNDDLIDKLKSNMQVVLARGGQLYVFADVGSGISSEDGMTVIPMPHCDDLIAPIVYTVPLQLLSYYVAVMRGTDVDQPRNLAKSVTVE